MVSYQVTLADLGQMRKSWQRKEFTSSWWRWHPISTRKISRAARFNRSWCTMTSCLNQVWPRRGSLRCFRPTLYWGTPGSISHLSRRPWLLMSKLSNRKKHLTIIILCYRLTTTSLKSLPRMNARWRPCQRPSPSLVACSELLPHW